MCIVTVWGFNQSPLEAAVASCEDPVLARYERWTTLEERGLLLQRQASCPAIADRRSSSLLRMLLHIVMCEPWRRCAVWRRRIEVGWLEIEAVVYY